MWSLACCNSQSDSIPPEGTTDRNRPHQCEAIDSGLTVCVSRASQVTLGGDVSQHCGHEPLSVTRTCSDVTSREKGGGHEGVDLLIKGDVRKGDSCGKWREEHCAQRYAFRASFSDWLYDKILCRWGGGGGGRHAVQQSPSQELDSYMREGWRGT